MKKIFLLSYVSFLATAIISTAGFSSEIPAEKLLDLSKLEAFLNVENLKPVTEGQRALVYFWAEWCPDCKQKMKKELPDLFKRGVSIYTVNKDSRKKKAKNFIEKFGITLPIYRDEDKKISKPLKAFSVPHWGVVEHQSNNQWKTLKFGSGSLEPALSYFQNKKKGNQ